MRTRQRAAICSTVDDRWVVAIQQPQSRGLVTTFEPHARALTVRMFGAIAAVLFGRCAAVVVCRSLAVTLLQLLSATCSTSRLGTWHSGAPRNNCVAMNDLPRCPELSQLPGTTRVLARARSACTVPKDRAKRLVLSRSPARHPPTGVGRLRPQSTKTCVQHLRACRATRACCATREGRKTRSRQIRTGWLAGVTLGRP